MRKQIDDSELPIAEWIAKNSEIYIHPENREHPFNRWARVVWCPWASIGLLLAVVAYIYNLDSRHCHLCNQLVEIFPSIDTAASIALADSKVIRIVWLYYTVTTPFVYLSGIPAVSKLEIQEPKSIWQYIHIITTIGVLVFIGIYVFLNGGRGFLDKPERFFVHTVVGGWAWSSAIFFTICVSPVLITGIIFIFFKRLRGY